MARRRAWMARLLILGRRDFAAGTPGVSTMARTNTTRKHKASKGRKRKPARKAKRTAKRTFKRTAKRKTARRPAARKTKRTAKRFNKARKTAKRSFKRKPAKRTAKRTWKASKARSFKFPAARSTFARRRAA
jgi:hypothetical protein